MEFRDKLLGSELRHITELVNMLSYELVIIQDFMTHEFGGRFRRFREKHVLYSGSGSSESCGEAPSVSKRPSPGMSRPQRLHVNNTAGETASTSATHTTTQDLAHGNEEPLVTMKSQMGTSDMVIDNEDDDQQPFDEIHDIGDSNFANNDANADAPFISTNSNDDMEGENDYDSDDSRADKTWSEKIYRKNSGSGKPIWNKFDWKRLPGGKRVVKCKKCLQSVSPVAKRLEKHYQRCVLNNSEFVETSMDGSVSGITTASSSFNEKKSAGKPPSGVWTHFNKITSPNGPTIVTCKYCDKKCSNHATRMGRHLAMCKQCPDDITF